MVRAARQARGKPPCDRADARDADRDRGETRSRAVASRCSIPNTRAQGTLEENFEVRRYFFDARLQTTKDFVTRDDGRASAIGGFTLTGTAIARGNPAPDGRQRD